MIEVDSGTRHGGFLQMTARTSDFTHNRNWPSSFGPNRLTRTIRIVANGHDSWHLDNFSTLNPLTLVSEPLGVCTSLGSAFGLWRANLVTPTA
jgi:hypothetical protein